MSIFDPNVFLQTSVETPFETRYTPIPAREYTAVIGSGEKDVNVTVLNARDGSHPVVMEIWWNILDDALKTEMNLQNPRVRQRFFLDLDPATGRLLSGTNNNTKLGAVRDAVGQNGPGQWSPVMLKGAGPARIRTKQTIDKEDANIKYSEVDVVARLT